MHSVHVVQLAADRAGDYEEYDPSRAAAWERVARKFMVAPYRIPRGCVATYFPEANVLVPIDSVAAKSNTPTSKYVIVTLTAATEGG